MPGAAISRFLLRSLILPLSFGLLSGCASLWQSEAVAPGDLEREKLRAISTWRLEGRINVRTPDDGWTANVEWRHADDENRIALNGPFAQRAASIVHKKDFLAFAAADGSRAESDDPEKLLMERLGFSVPLDALRYWVMALPAPEQDFTPHAAPPDAAALVGFDQAGWSMHYDSFMQEGVWVLPRKMVIQGRGVVLKLIVDSWVIDG